MAIADAVDRRTDKSRRQLISDGIERHKTRFAQPRSGSETRWRKPKYS
jgi:hypothetical protein